MILAFFLSPLILHAETMSAIPASDIEARLGINTHLQYTCYGNETGSTIFSTVYTLLKNLGIKNIRDRSGHGLANRDEQRKELQAQFQMMSLF